MPPTPPSARRARELARHALRVAGVADDSELAARLCLVTSELVTNAVLHAGTKVVLRIEVDGSGVYVEVSDGAPSRPELAPLSQSATRGRGLALVDFLADRWGVDDAETGAGKRVWAHLTPD